MLPSSVLEKVTLLEAYNEQDAEFFDGDRFKLKSNMCFLKLKLSVCRKVVIVIVTVTVTLTVATLRNTN